MAQPSTAKEIEETNLEDDDLFEEFAGEAEVEVDLKNEKELPLWEASWDDEDLGDFSAELKAELAKAAK